MAMANTVVIGNWENFYQGYCNQIDHRYNRACCKTYPSSVTQDLDEFTNLLHELQPIASIQIVSNEPPSTLEYFYDLLTVIGNNCPALECLGLVLDLTDADRKVDKANINLDLDSVDAGTALTPDQISCVSTWRQFMECIKPTIQHICLVGDLNIPLFAVKIMLKDCPNFSLVDGGYGGESVTSPEKLREVIDRGEQAKEFTFFIHMLGCPDFNLPDISTGFVNLRTIIFSWTPEMDFSVFANPSLANLATFILVNSDFNPEAGADTDTGEMMPPTIDLTFPQNSKLMELFITGLRLSQGTWDGLGQQTPLLFSVFVKKSGGISSENLEPLQNLQKLELLTLEGSNDVRGPGIVPLMTSSDGKNRFCFRFKLTNNTITDNEEIQEIVTQILNTHALELDLKGVGRDLESGEGIPNVPMEGGSGVTIEFKDHTGGFDFLKKMVEEEMGFTFTEEMDSETKVWKCSLKHEQVGERYLTLMEAIVPTASVCPR